MGLYDRLDLFQLMHRKPIVVGRFNPWIKPKLGFTVPAMDMDMDPGFFSGKKEKPLALGSEHYRTHGMIMAATIIRQQAASPAPTAPPPTTGAPGPG